MYRDFGFKRRWFTWYNHRMETTRRISDIDAGDRAVLERVFGQPLEPSAEVVLIVKSGGSPAADSTDEASPNELPSWCNVLEGMTDAELAEFDALLNMPVRLGRTG